MKRKEGWFKKSVKRFISKRVFSWRLFRYESYDDAKVEYFEDGNVSLRYRAKDDDYQVIKKIADLGFTKGFLKAREYAKEHKNKWLFRFDKIIKL